MWYTARLAVEGCKSAGGNTGTGRASAPPLSALPYGDLHSWALILALDNEVWLRRRTVRSAHGGEV